MTSITSIAEDGGFPVFDLLLRPEILQSNPKSVRTFMTMLQSRMRINVTSLNRFARNIGK